MNKELEKLIAEYKKCAEMHGVATKEGNHKVTNKEHDKLIKVLKMIRQYGDEGSAALLTLTDDENKSVMCWAAIHSLKYDKEKSKKTLQNLKKQNGPIAFDAEMVLSEWEKGTLEIP